MSNVRWKDAEHTVKLLTGGTLTPGSGNGWAKGDIRVPDTGDGPWMVEVKSTYKDNIRLLGEWLHKLEKHRHTYNLALVLVTAADTLVYVFAHRQAKEEECVSISSSLAITCVDGKPVPDKLKYSSHGVWEAWLPEELRYETKER